MRRLLPGFMLAGIWLGQSACHTGDRPSPTHRWTAGATPLLASAQGNAPSPAPHPGVRFHSKPKPLPGGAVTHDWTSFLGPTHNGVSTETRLLKDWPDGGPPLVWELTKGTGYTSPAIHNSRLVYFYRQGQEEIVDCLHPETGQRYWTFRYPTSYSDRYGYNDGPRCSPVIDGNRVYTYGADGKLHCLRLETGEVVWKRHLSKEFRVSQDFFGVASTPLVEGDLLIVNLGAGGGPSIVGLDKGSGKLVWGGRRPVGPQLCFPRSGHGQREETCFCLCRRRKPASHRGAVEHRSRGREDRLPLSLAKPQLRVGQRFQPGGDRQPGTGLGQLQDGSGAARPPPRRDPSIGLDRAPLRPALEHGHSPGRGTSTVSTAATSPMGPWCASI